MKSYSYKFSIEERSEGDADAKIEALSGKIAQSDPLFSLQIDPGFSLQTDPPFSL